MSRHKDIDWNIVKDPTFPGATLAVLMDIRDELKIISRVITCNNTSLIPIYLRKISGFTGILARKEEGKKGKKK